MMGYGYDGGGGWMWGFVAVVALGVLVLIGLAVWAVITTINRPRHSAAGTEAPVSGNTSGRERTRQLLDERYARGEMNTDDYTERLHTLGL